MSLLLPKAAARLHEKSSAVKQQLEEKTRQRASLAGWLKGWAWAQAQTVTASCCGQTRELDLARALGYWKALAPQKERGPRFFALPRLRDSSHSQKRPL